MKTKLPIEEINFKNGEFPLNKKDWDMYDKEERKVLFKKQFTDLIGEEYEILDLEMDKRFTITTRHNHERCNNHIFKLRTIDLFSNEACPICKLITKNFTEAEACDYADIISDKVYIFYDKDENPLYVGKTKNIKRRIYQHKRDKNWFNEVLRIDIAYTFNKTNTDIYEIYYINLLKPKYNIASLYNENVITKLEELNFYVYEYIPTTEAK